MTEKRRNVSRIYHRFGEIGLRWGEVQAITTGDVAGCRPLGRPAAELGRIAQVYRFLANATTRAILVNRYRDWSMMQEMTPARATR